jgi:hypothetical protein
LKQILSKGLEQTAAVWFPIAIAYNWVHEAAKMLDNQAGLDASLVQLCFQALLNAMSACRGAAGYLESGILHFLKVTNSYWSGLFHCHSVPGLPRTNNDLEHIFGRVRHHQRRCTGRKVAPASLVLRGSVQLVACIATQISTFDAEQLSSLPVEDWRELRSQLEQHRINRVKQLRFRRSPADYLANLESQFL